MRSPSLPFEPLGTPPRFGIGEVGEALGVRWFLARAVGAEGMVRGGGGGGGVPRRGAVRVYALPNQVSDRRITS